MRAHPTDLASLTAEAFIARLRYAGDHEPARLSAFLDEHAATMPRVTLRNAIEKRPPEERKAWLALGRAG
jgi:hypothetical protein